MLQKLPTRRPFIDTVITMFPKVNYSIKEAIDIENYETCRKVRLSADKRLKKGQQQLDLKFQALKKELLDQAYETSQKESRVYTSSPNNRRRVVISTNESRKFIKIYPSRAENGQRSRGKYYASSISHLDKSVEVPQENKRQFVRMKTGDYSSDSIAEDSKPQVVPNRISTHFQKLIPKSEYLLVNYKKKLNKTAENKKTLSGIQSRYKLNK